MEISEKMLEFIRCHANDDVHALNLKYSGKKKIELGFDLDFALIQIEARRKARKKLPSFVSEDKFLFPSLVSEEQATNEAIARFHASLVTPESSLLDLTAGLGIDDFEFAKTGISVTSCEIDPIKCEVLCHNAQVLGLDTKIEVENCDSIAYVNNPDRVVYDVVFADPARRNESGRRVHALSDCKPDILTALPRILTISNRLIVKASPLLDLSLIRKTVNDLSKIYVVCFRGECKEVLMEIVPGNTFEGTTVIDLDWYDEISRFDFGDTQDNEKVSIQYYEGKMPAMLKYIYEPNAGIMKVSDWLSLCTVFPDLQKLDPNTHIFISDTLYQDFPGRILEIASFPTKKELKALKGKKVNIVARNYPIPVPEFSKKYNIISGGSDYLYAFRCGGIPGLILAKPFRKGQE